MMNRMTVLPLLAIGMLSLAACVDDATTAPLARPRVGATAATVGPVQFEPLTSSATCTAGGNANAPFAIPAGFAQVNVASEPDYLGNPDMITQNETGPEAGRYIFQPHELGLNTNTGVSVTDLLTGTTKMLVQRNDWGSLDGIAWTPWGTVLTAEERSGGKVWEIDPQTGAAVARPAIGLKAHEGMRFDPQGNLYSISETNPGFIFKFVPDERGDLSSGQAYALKVTSPSGDRVGEAEWIPLSRTAVQIDANAAAASAGATGYNRPEDVEIATSTGNNRGDANVLYVAQGTGAKAARSDDQGVTFTDFDTGLDNAGLPRDIAITADTSAPRLLMATGKGSYATPIPGGGVTDRIFQDGFDGP